MSRKNFIEETIDDVLGEEKYLKADVQMGLELKEMMETKGWTEWFYPMFDQLILNLGSIDGVTTLRELEGRKQTVTALKHLKNSLGALVDKANISTIKLQQEEELKSLQDS